MRSGTATPHPPAGVNIGNPPAGMGALRGGGNPSAATPFGLQLASTPRPPFMGSGSVGSAGPLTPHAGGAPSTPHGLDPYSMHAAEPVSLADKLSKRVVDVLISFKADSCDTTKLNALIVEIRNKTGR